MKVVQLETLMAAEMAVTLDLESDHQKVVLMDMM